MKIRFNPSTCIYCKGRYPKKFCGRSYCPIYSKINAYKKIKKVVESISKKEHYNSFSGDIFVSRFNYPYLDIGLLSPVDNIENSTSVNEDKSPSIGLISNVNKQNKLVYFYPKMWIRGMGIRDIVNLRIGLINTSFKLGVKDIRYYSNNNRIVRSEKNKMLSKLTEAMKEIAMAKIPVDVELKIDKKIRLKSLIEPSTPPIGPKTGLRRVRITENVSVERIVEKVVYDSDLKTQDAIKLLIEKGKDNYEITKLLSSGLLGQRQERRLVPTRWSITAVDDIIAKEKLKNIRNFDKINHTKIFSGNLFGNYYIIALFPLSWCYELIETYMPESSWNFSNKIYWLNDYEGFNGRKNYADNTAGGYYATRVAICEYLFKHKIQAGALAIRLMSSEYAIPLGVWVVREATRKVMNNEIKIIEGSKRDDMKKALVFIMDYLKNRFNFSNRFINDIFSKSYIINRILRQSMLNDWI